MPKPVRYVIGLVLCLFGVSCGLRPTPSPVSEQPITISISAANYQTQLIKDKETAFYIEIEPPSVKGQVANVNVFGDRGIQCVQSDGDIWTWYCTGTLEAKTATVFAEVTGDLPQQVARYTVEIVGPTATPAPSPTATPWPTYTPNPTETPTPTITPTPVPPTATVTPLTATPLRPPTETQTFGPPTATGVPPTATPPPTDTPSPLPTAPPTLTDTPSPIPPTPTPTPIDDLDTLANWTFGADEKGSTVENNLTQGNNTENATDGAMEISYTLQPYGWVIITKDFEPGVLVGTGKIGFWYKGNGALNTIEFKLIHKEETCGNNENKRAIFSVEWSRATNTNDNWKYLEADYSEFSYWATTACNPNESLDLEKVDRIEFAISSRPHNNDNAGQGTVVIDDIQAE